MAFVCRYLGGPSDATVGCGKGPSTTTWPLASASTSGKYVPVSPDGAHRAGELMRVTIGLDNCVWDPVSSCMGHPVP